MTPELIQAIQILQYNVQELDTYIEEQLLVNPILEVNPVNPEDDIAGGDLADAPISVSEPEMPEKLNANVHDEDFDYCSQEGMSSILPGAPDFRALKALSYSSILYTPPTILSIWKRPVARISSHFSHVSYILLPVTP